MHRVAIVGGGFGGLYLAKSLRAAPVAATLIDRRNFHLFQPLLYQVATGGLSPANIAAPLRSVLQRQRNVQVVLGDVTGFDVAERRVILRDGSVDYDTLVVAAGVRHSYFGHAEWEAHAPGLKTVEDATDIRSRILRAFEAAERAEERAAVRRWLTFVIVGGGPTGVELAGAVAEIARHTLRGEFRHINPADATILLVEAGPRILAGYPPHLSDRAARSLERLGVTVLTGARVSDVRDGVVDVSIGGAVERIEAHTVLWAAGVQASPLGASLAAATGVALDELGRVIVEGDCTIRGGGVAYPEIFVIGDLAHFPGPDGRPLPGVAPVAMQQGRFVAEVIVKRLRAGRTDLSDDPLASRFVYVDKGSMATIGRAAAVAQIGRLTFSGYPAWLLWLFVHILFLIEFQNRVLVMLQWAWNYFTWNRSARLITDGNRVRG